LDPVALLTDVKERYDRRSAEASRNLEVQADDGLRVFADRLRDE
jgi:hypothetical protein